MPHTELSRVSEAAAPARPVLGPEDLTVIYPQAEAFLARVREAGLLERVAVRDVPADAVCKYGVQPLERGPFWTLEWTDGYSFDVISITLNPDHRSVEFNHRYIDQGCRTFFAGELLERELLATQFRAAIEYLEGAFIERHPPIAGVLPTDTAGVEVVGFNRYLPESVLSFAYVPALCRQAGRYYIRHGTDATPFTAENALSIRRPDLERLGALPADAAKSGVVFSLNHDVLFRLEGERFVVHERAHRAAFCRALLEEGATGDRIYGALELAFTARDVMLFARALRAVTLQQSEEFGGKLDTYLSSVRQFGERLGRQLPAELFPPTRNEFLALTFVEEVPPAAPRSPTIAQRAAESAVFRWAPK